MASKGGKHHSKKSSSRRSYKKTTGGTSQRNYSKKQKNLDYRYRILDNQDASQAVWYNSTTAMYSRFIAAALSELYKKYPEIGLDKEANDAALFMEQKGFQVFCEYLMAGCQFIPLSTSQMVSKNMTVEVKSRYPFAYCLFQNTPTFKTVFQKYLTTSILTQSGGTAGNFMDIIKANWPNNSKLISDCEDFVGLIDIPFFLNAFGNDDSGFVMPMMQSGGADLQVIKTGAESSSTKWSQICRAQSSYREVKSPTNGGEFTANINVYYSRASQFLTGDSVRNSLTRGYKFGQVQMTGGQLNLNVERTTDLASPFTTEATRVAMNSYGSSYNIIQQQNYDTIFRNGDMILCVLPTWYFDTVTPQTVGYQYRPPFPMGYVDTNMVPQINILRHYYILNQDVGLKEVDNVATLASISINNYYNATVLGFSTMGNSLALSNKIVRNAYNRSKGVQVFPLVRAEVDNFAQNTNCVIVDEKCYDETKQELEMVAYMDCQPVPANVGNQILESVEGEDTINCNAIVSCGNKTDSDTLLDATVTNTGPSIMEVTNNNIELSDSDSFYLDGTYYSNNYASKIGQSGALARTSVANYDVVQTDQPWFQSYTVEVDTTSIQAFVEMVNRNFNLQLIIPAVYEADQIHHDYVFSFSVSDGCQYYGFQPTGSSGESYMRLILPMGVALVTSGSTYQTLQVRMYKGYSTLTQHIDAAEPVGEPQFEINPLMYEMMMTFVNTSICRVVGNQDGQSYGQYSLNEFSTTDYLLNPEDQGYVGNLQDTPVAQNIYQYLKLWLIDYNGNVLYAGKVWKKIKGFFSKVVKYIRDKALPFFKKVTDTVAPIVPAPYGTVVTGVGSAVNTIQTALNLIAAKKNAPSDNPAVQADDAVVDQFTVIPQYRLSDSDQPADIAAAGEDWYDGEQMTVDVDQYGNSVTHVASHKLIKHPQYLAIKQKLLGVNVQGLDVGSFCQQRIKVIFKKTGVTPQMAKTYKAVLALGSDTQYLSDSDYQQQDTNVANQ